MSYDVLIVDDIGYVQQSKNEADIISQWERIFKDPMMTITAKDDANFFLNPRKVRPKLQGALV